MVQIKGHISERKLLANRANAKHSTGPQTAAGKVASRRNALKHGILSRALDLSNMTTRPGLNSLTLGAGAVSEALGADSALREISRIWDRLAKIVVFEKECSQRPAGLERSARLIARYERMLTRQLHARILECSGLDKKV